MTFEPTLNSLRSHASPRWYDDAKFGIFIHWGLFSIPAFASRLGSISDVFRDHYDSAAARTPYTEWYWNAIKVEESESARHHRAVWGGAPYQDFRKPFLAGLELWKPNDWAESFVRAGARYVVLVTKHHDGFCLWPSAVRNRRQAGWTTTRDVVGELADAVRARGLKFGIYYSGGIDWTFNREPLHTLGDFLGSVPGGDYLRYADAQMRELIALYRPDILWNDIAWPAPLSPMLSLFADYYNRMPDGVINDRWTPQTRAARLLRYKFLRRQLDRTLKKRLRASPGGIVPPLPPHCDFRTPEYTTFKDIEHRKWEATRGMSQSFGYNRDDTDTDYESVESLVRGFIDTVSKNGNLLLNVGPRGEDAAIPEGQLARLEGFGAWLRANGEAIYATRPWSRAEGRTDVGTPVRFTTRQNTLYAHVLGSPTPGSIVLEGQDIPPASHAVHVASRVSVPCRRVETGLELAIDRPLAPAPAHAFALARA